MTDRLHIFARTAALAALLTLGACNRGAPGEAELANLDAEIAGNEADPALTGALEDQIMVDPALKDQSNKLAVRPPERPMQAEYPAARPASVQSAGGAADGDVAARVRAGCGTQFDYDPKWANRMPAAFPMIPDARLTEAAGNATCRVVTFATEASIAKVVDYYRARATRAGYTAESQVRGGDTFLAGTQGDAAYYLIVSPREGGGSDGALIANGGA